MLVGVESHCGEQHKRKGGREEARGYGSGWHRIAFRGPQRSAPASHWGKGWMKKADSGVAGVTQDQWGDTGAAGVTQEYQDDQEWRETSTSELGIAKATHFGAGYLLLKHERPIGKASWEMVVITRGRGRGGEKSCLPE